MNTSPGRIISFYSYKGGVGRSMALANAAALLASQGRKVLVVDFDLEAPGLHRYFKSPDVSQGESLREGLIDLLVEMRERMGSAPLGVDVPGAVAIALLESDRFSAPIPVTLFESASPCHIEFMRAGRFDDVYAERVHGFHWKEFFESGGLDAIANWWREHFDFVLIDSRTGIADISSVTTVLLPEALVCVFSPNEQSLHGAVEIARQAARQRGDLGRGRLDILPLLSRVEDAEEELKRQWIAQAANRFEKVFEELGWAGVRLERFFDAVRVPYRSHFAYGERLAVESNRIEELGSLAQAYSRLVSLITAGRVQAWLESPAANVLLAPNVTSLPRFEFGDVTIRLGELLILSSAVRYPRRESATERQLRLKELQDRLGTIPASEATRTVFVWDPPRDEEAQLTRIEAHQIGISIRGRDVALPRKAIRYAWWQADGRPALRLEPEIIVPEDAVGRLRLDFSGVR